MKHSVMNSIDPLLRSHLEPLVQRRSQIQLYGKLALCWLATGLLALIPGVPLALAAGCGTAVAVFVFVRHRRKESDWRWAARQIEARHPELEGLLLTAVQQQGKEGQELNYLQEQLVRQAIDHSARNDWTAAVPSHRLGITHTLHLLTLGFCLAMLWQSRPAPVAPPRQATAPAKSGLTVTPGDVSLERGSSLVVMARFEGPTPAGVNLVIGRSPETSRRIPLVRSLADPMFGGTVPEVTADFVYHLEHGSERTRDFQVKVFEYPRLDRSDVDLNYPAYTSLAPKRIEDTRRLSAVEGTRLDLTLQFNKPVASARLVARDGEGNSLSLTVASNRPTATLKQLPLAASRTYQLQLVDAEGRTNKVPAQFVFDVLKNRRPELKLASPRGDLRPSALEEVVFEGTVWDDFGVPAYGLAYALAGGDLKLIELGQGAPAKEKRAFRHLLRLENLGVQPDDFVSWFVWAEDIGPDGQKRRTSGDLFFAEVRPFEEIFREEQGGDSQSAQQQQPQQSGEQSGESGSPSGKLAELQKQIISATWKLWREQSESLPRTREGQRGTGEQPRPRSSAPRAGSSAPEATSPHATSSDRAVALPPRRWGSLFFGQVTPRAAAVQLVATNDPAARPRAASATATNQVSQFESDTAVVRDSQEQALEQAGALKERVQDQRLAALWEAAVQQMERALEKLKAAEQSPALLQEALAAEQAAYQALLRLQEREYSVSRSRQQNQRGSQNRSSRQQQMQQQLDQLDLQQSENRYETQREAQAPQSQERREQLQVMNRLQELARRQQDVNERLQELQTALQEAQTEEQREEIRRQLKRLQEEERQMLADVDELQQRMNRPENQSRLAEQRQQLDQARQDMQRAAQAAEQGSPSQALAAGARAQRQMQQMRDDLRRQNASEFAEDLRQMRAEARELARQQEQVQQQLDALSANQRRTLSDSTERQELLDRLNQQKTRTTNLVERATQVSQQAETAEPLASRELYDTLRRFSQEDANSVRQLQEELLNRGLLTRSLYDRLKETNERDGAKSLEVTAEMLRQDLLPQADQAEERARAGIDNLRRGVERAAERVLGDDTESLRQAQRQLEELTRQLEREIARGEGGADTNAPGQRGGAQAQSGGQQQQRDARQQAQSGNAQSQSGQPAQASEGRQPGQPAQANDGQGPPTPGNQSEQARQEGQRTGEPGNQRGGQQRAEGQPQGQPREGQGGNQSGDARQDQNDNAEARSPTGEPRSASRTQRSLQEGAPRADARDGNRQRAVQTGGRGGRGGGLEDLDWFNADSLQGSAPLTGEDFAPWSDRLREVEEMVELPSLRNDLATARERARRMRLEFKRDLKKPDWAVVRLQVMKPLVEVRQQIAEELARRDPKDNLVPIDRDPVPSKFSDLVRRYYEELGKQK